MDKGFPLFSQDVLDRFWSKTIPEPNTGCILWTGALNRDGYGAFGVGPNRWIAHRFSWLITFGEIVNGLFICHNPDHLFAGTNLDNIRDRTIKGRSARGDNNGSRLHPESRPRGDNSGSRRFIELRPRGDSHACSKLTADDVLEIRKSISEGTETRRQLSERFPVGYPCIKAVVSRRIWRHI